MQANAPSIIDGSPQAEYGTYYAGYVVPYRMAQASMAGFTVDVNAVSGGTAVHSADGRAFDLRTDRMTERLEQCDFRMAGVLRDGPIDTVRLLSWQRFTEGGETRVLVVASTATQDVASANKHTNPAVIGDCLPLLVSQPVGHHQSDVEAFLNTGWLESPKVPVDVTVSGTDVIVTPKLQTKGRQRGQVQSHTPSTNVASWWLYAGTQTPVFRLAFPSELPMLHEHQETGQKLPAAAAPESTVYCDLCEKDIPVNGKNPAKVTALAWMKCSLDHICCLQVLGSHKGHCRKSQPAPPPAAKA